MAQTYRQWLQGKANAGDSNASYALDYQGDDGGINGNWVSLENNARQNPGQQYSQYLLNRGSAMRGLYNDFNSQKGLLGAQSGRYSGGGSSAPAYDPADLAWLDSQIGRTQGQYGIIDNALTRGTNELNDSHQRAVNDANFERGRAIENFGIERDKTNRSKDRALDRNNDNARQLLNSLRRRIALAGGSNSSAYQQEAPGAVADTAGENRSNIMEDFGVNFMNLARAE